MEPITPKMRISVGPAAPVSGRGREIADDSKTDHRSLATPGWNGQDPDSDGSVWRDGQSSRAGCDAASWDLDRRDPD